MKLFVSNFPKDYSEENIKLIFSPFGEIKSIEIMNKLKKFAIVEFQTSQQSITAMNILNGKKLYGHEETLNVDIAFDRNRRVIVTNIPLNVSKEILMKFFMNYGVIENITSKDTKTIFIDFRFQEDAKKFLELDNKINFKNERLIIKPFLKKEKISNTGCIFLYNLSPNTTETDILEAFEKYGRIVSFKILNGGKGFINYEKELFALKAIRHMDGKRLNGKKLRIVLKSK